MLNFRDFFLIHNLIKIYFKTHQTAPYFLNFLMGAIAYAPEFPSICVQLQLVCNFYMKIAIFYPRFFQNTYQNASIINFSKNFFTRIISTP